MDADMVQAFLRQRAAAQASQTNAPVGSSSAKVPKKRAKSTASRERAGDQVKKIRTADKGKGAVEPESDPFSFPEPGTPLDRDSIFSRQYDHAGLCDKLAVRSDRDLLWQSGVNPSCRLIQAAGLQIALAAREVEKMWDTYVEERNKRVSELENQLETAKQESSAKLKKQLEEAQKCLGDSQNRVSELEKQAEAAQKEISNFETVKEQMMMQAAEYLEVGFERAKFQVSKAHPGIDLSMLDMVILDKDFAYSPEGDEGEDGDEEGGDGGAPGA